MKPLLNIILILPLFCALTLKAQHKEAFDKIDMRMEKIPKFEDNDSGQAVISIYNPFKGKISFQLEFNDSVMFVSIDPEKLYLIKANANDEYHFAISDSKGGICKGILTLKEKNYRICVDLNEKKYCICSQ